jgi:hypothetical protein
MAQRREKRNRRRSRPAAVPTGPSPVAVRRRRNLRAALIVLAIVIGLAGIFVVSAPGDDPDGQPADEVPIG